MQILWWLGEAFQIKRWAFQGQALADRHKDQDNEPTWTDLSERIDGRQ